MGKQYAYIIVDDDSINNMVCESIIKKHYPNTPVFSFLTADEGLAFLEDEQLHNKAIIIFLDINMPEMDGWEFIEEFLQKDAGLREQVNIFMLSSSIDRKDIEKSKSYSCVLDYIVKPLNKEKLIEAHLKLDAIHS